MASTFQERPEEGYSNSGKEQPCGSPQLINDLKAAVTPQRSLRSLLCAGEAVPQLPHSILLAGGKAGGGEAGEYEEKKEGKWRCGQEHRMKGARGESAGSTVELFIILSPCDCDLWAPPWKRREMGRRGGGRQSGTRRGRNR